MRVDSTKFVIAAHSGSDLITDGLPELAFAGRSNVGKSSLLNRLLGRKALARVSSTPGRTRSINYFLVNERCYFVDLPGYGYAKVAKEMRHAWARLMDSYFRQQRERVRVIQLVDMKVGATDLDAEAFRYFSQVGVPSTLVATKCDKLPRSRHHRTLAGIRQHLSAAPDLEIIPFSAKSGEGVKELWRVVEDFLHKGQENKK